MHNFVISYDLSAPGRDYTSLFEAIKNQSTYWIHPQESVWVIRSAQNAAAVRDALKLRMDANDSLVVLELSGVGAWYGLNETASSALKSLLEGTLVA